MAFIHLPHSSKVILVVINVMVYLGSEVDAFLNLVFPPNLKASNLTFHLNTLLMMIDPDVKGRDSWWPLRFHLFWELETEGAGAAGGGCPVLQQTHPTGGYTAGSGFSRTAWYNSLVWFTVTSEN